MNRNEETKQLGRAYPLDWCDHQWQLLPEAALYWPIQQMLILSDLHLGREVTFQRAGLALPLGPTLNTLQRIQQLLIQLNESERCVRKLVILGDLVHARCSLSRDVTTALENLLQEFVGIEFHLVEGNHDRGSTHRLQQLGFHCHTHWSVGDINLVHEADRQVNQPTVVGHLHPGIALERSGQKYRCFVVDPLWMVLPAFGDLTGTMNVGKRRDTRYYVTAGSLVRQVPDPACRS